MVTFLSRRLFPAAQAEEFKQIQSLLDAQVCPSCASSFVGADESYVSAMLFPSRIFDVRFLLLLSPRLLR
jgi:hypothetical protein